MRCLLALVILVASLGCGTARADVIFDVFFRLPGLGDSLDATFNVAPGQTFTGVQAIVRETVTGGSASALAAANINGFGINIGVTGSNGSTGGKVTNTTGGFAAFSDSPTTFGYFALAGGIAPTDLGGGIREFSLGTLNLTAPTAGTTTFSLIDPNPGLPGDITTFIPGPGFAGLESVGPFRTRSVSLEAVPEPSGLLALALPAAFACVRRRRSRV